MYRRLDTNSNVTLILRYRFTTLGSASLLHCLAPTARAASRRLCSSREWLKVKFDALRTSLVASSDRSVVVKRPSNALSSKPIRSSSNRCEDSGPVSPAYKRFPSSFVLLSVRGLYKTRPVLWFARPTGIIEPVVASAAEGLWNEPQLVYQ